MTLTDGDRPKRRRFTDYWVCAVCGGAVSKQMGQHKHLRVRRADGSGWDHTKCRPAGGGAQDVLQQLELRRAEAVLR